MLGMLKALLNWLRRDLDWREDWTREGLRMKRRVSGIWEYREPTEAERYAEEMWKAVR